MQTRPCRLITAPAERTLQRYRAHTVLLADQQPHGAKPDSQWRSRILKHRACGRRNLIPAAGALHAARLQRPAFACFTSRTTESARPAEIEQVLPASLLSAETPLKLQKCARIIFFHDPEHYRLGLPESHGYPVYKKRRLFLRGQVAPWVAIVNLLYVFRYSYTFKTGFRGMHKDETACKCIRINGVAAYASGEALPES